MHTATCGTCAPRRKSKVQRLVNTVLMDAPFNLPMVEWGFLFWQMLDCS
jgi:hypothetical protein